MFGALLAVEMSKECTPLWRDARFQVKTYKTQHVRSLFGSSHFRCRKSARCCGVKHISESKCSKHYMFGPLLDVQMSFVRPAQGIVHLVKSEQNVRVSSHVQKRWQAWDICGFALPFVIHNNQPLL